MCEQLCLPLCRNRSCGRCMPCESGIPKRGETSPATIQSNSLSCSSDHLLGACGRPSICRYCWALVLVPTRPSRPRALVAVRRELAARAAGGTSSPCGTRIMRWSSCRRTCQRILGARDGSRAQWAHRSSPLRRVRVRRRVRAKPTTMLPSSPRSSRPSMHSATRATHGSPVRLRARLACHRARR